MMPAGEPKEWAVICPDFVKGPLTREAAERWATAMNEPPTSRRGAGTCTHEHVVVRVSELGTRAREMRK